MFEDATQRQRRQGPARIDVENATLSLNALIERVFGGRHMPPSASSRNANCYQQQTASGERERVNIRTVQMMTVYSSLAASGVSE